MLLTTALLYKVMRDRWGWSVPSAVLTSGVFLVVDSAFSAANLLKIVEGGWIPLTFGAIVFTVMNTWHSGIEALRRRLATMTEPPQQFLDRLKRTGFRACRAGSEALKASGT
jgi:KUP system potassium uptake protein